MSSTLFNVLFAWKCSSTHHKLALDALNQLRGEGAENWRNLCLSKIETYLEGSKAPDDKFKDFRNHVLHVRDNHWGGAVGATRLWYGKTVEALRAKNWSEAVYASGVLSHYFTDPIQPFHTGQCEAEGIVHRAAEWSIACAYRELTDILEADLGGWPDVTVPSGADWLEKLVVAGAELANPHYEICIDHYDMKKGVKDPPAGLDQELKDRIARLIGHAVVGYARVMERALSEANVTLPVTNITLLGVMAKLTIPLFWITKKLKDAKERAIVEATFREYEATGKVIDTLSEDDATIRKVHAEEVLKQPLEQLDAEEPRPIGTAHGEGAPARPRPVKSVSAKVALPKIAQKTPVEPAAPTAAPTIPVRTTAAVTASAAEKKKTEPSSSTKTTSPKPVAPKVEPAPNQPAAATTAPAFKEPVPEKPPAKTVSAEKLVEAKATSPADQAPVEKVVLTKESRAAEQLRNERPVAEPRGDKFYLTVDMPVEKAPSIGGKTAKLLERHGVKTVGDLLIVEPELLASEIGDRYVNADTIETWQIQADLCCEVPNLRGHDAQILVACDICNREELATANGMELLKKVEEFVATPAGERILRGGESPDLKEVTDWITWAGRPQVTKAA